MNPVRIATELSPALPAPALPVTEAGVPTARRFALPWLLPAASDEATALSLDGLGAEQEEALAPDAPAAVADPSAVAPSPVALLVAGTERPAPAAAAGAFMRDGALVMALAQRTRAVTQAAVPELAAAGVAVPAQPRPEGAALPPLALPTLAVASVRLAPDAAAPTAPAGADAAAPLVATLEAAPLRDPALPAAAEAHAPVPARRLAAALGERIHYQSAQGVDVATLRLDPPQLGTLEIRIRHDADGVHVVIQASHSEVGRQLAGLAEALRQDLQARQPGVAATVTVGTRHAGGGPAGRQPEPPPPQDESAPRVGRALDLDLDEGVPHMNKKTMAVGLLVLLAGSAGAAGGAWWFKQHQAAPRAEAGAAPREPDLDARAYRYVGLDKVIVLMKPGASVEPRYLSVDVVLRTDKGHEAATKSDLPMLRSVVVRTLSKLNAEQARSSEIDALAQAISRDLAAAYEPAAGPRPFAEAMIAKLIIE